MKYVVAFIVVCLTQNSFSFTNSVFKGSARFNVKPAHVQQFKTAVQRIIAPTLKEKGCISYEAYQVLDSRGQPTNAFEFHEVWRTKSDMLIDHKEKSSHMIDFFAKIRIGETDSWVDSFEVTGTEVVQLRQQ
jgi:quinol monooxygenase YgiN